MKWCQKLHSFLAENTKFLSKKSALVVLKHVLELVHEIVIQNDYFSKKKKKNERKHFK